MIYLEFKNFYNKDTHREKTHSNETPVLTKKNMDVWVVATSNQPFLRFLNWNKAFYKTKRFHVLRQKATQISP